MIPGTVAETIEGKSLHLIARAGSAFVFSDADTRTWFVLNRRKTTSKGRQRTVALVVFLSDDSVDVDPNVFLDTSYDGAECVSLTVFTPGDKS